MKKKLEAEASEIAIQADIVKQHFSVHETDLNKEIRDLLSLSGFGFSDASVGPLYQPDGIYIDKGRPFVIVEDKAPVGSGDPVTQDLVYYKYGRDDVGCL
eukprot:m.114663 g.114663  ORF g.114663 m.114663 type:complete len:100 (+) comp37518_c0_seq6:520-819(+)